MKLVALSVPQTAECLDHPKTQKRRNGAKAVSSICLKPPEPRFKVLSTSSLGKIPQLALLDDEQRFAMRVVAEVLPFRANNHVIELIDWSDPFNDPIFQLTFPQRGMLSDEHFGQMAALLTRQPGKAEIKVLARQIRRELNPHPAGQLQHNIPTLDGQALSGTQHKYAETVLFFPTQGQTCHAFCSFCFRWAQFSGDRSLRIASSDVRPLITYLQRSQQVSDVLITGGDPMVMKTRLLAQYLEALLAPELDHVRNIRIGSKALSFWPHRFVNDADADELMRLFERVVASGKHLAFMAHINHWRELDCDVAHEAVRRIRNTGATIRAQAPLLAHINDSADAWARSWREQVKLGIVPYYMFVERNTGAHCYFKVPLHRCLQIYRDAQQQVSGLCRTARGPSMSSGPGKIEIQGVTQIAGERVFVLRFLQARNPRWTHQPFFAKFDPEATWLNDLRPALGREKFFFEDELAQMAP